MNAFVSPSYLIGAVSAFGISRLEFRQSGLVFALAISLAVSGCATDGKQPSAGKTAPTVQTAVSDTDIVDAYYYLLGRVLVLRQEHLDFEKEQFEWNKLIYRSPAGVAWANPNLDVVYSEAWIAVDEKTCVLLHIPKIKGRYYTWQMLNGWGETLVNINERTFPQHPWGNFALCLKGSEVQPPQGALRVDLPAKTARVLARIELGSNPREALRLQRQFKLTAKGRVQPDKPVDVPMFEGNHLPGAEIFDGADSILASEPDINPGMEDVRAKLAGVESLLTSGAPGRARVEKVVTEQAVPALPGMLATIGTAKNGWAHPRRNGNYGDDYRMRTLANLTGIWANNPQEVTYFAAQGLDGGVSYTMTFPSDARPKDKVRYFWSVIAVDAKEYHVLPTSTKRYLLNKQSPLKYNVDGSLTLAFGPHAPKSVPESNWLPTVEGLKYNLTFRFYGPVTDVTDGTYYPPPLIGGD